MPEINFPHNMPPGSPVPLRELPRRPGPNHCSVSREASTRPMIVNVTSRIEPVQDNYSSSRMAEIAAYENNVDRIRDYSEVVNEQLADANRRMEATLGGWLLHTLTNMFKISSLREKLSLQKRARRNESAKYCSLINKNSRLQEDMVLLKEQYLVQQKKNSELKQQLENVNLTDKLSLLKRARKKDQAKYLVQQKKNSELKQQLENVNLKADELQMMYKILESERADLKLDGIDLGKD